MDEGQRPEDDYSHHVHVYIILVSFVRRADPEGNHGPAVSQSEIKKSNKIE